MATPSSPDSLGLISPPSSSTAQAPPSSSVGPGLLGDDHEQPPRRPREARSWAELPWDVLLAVLRRLDHADLLVGVGLVCGAWRRAARDEPELWRRITLRPRAGLSSGADLQELARAAVRRSAGRCEAFCGEGFGDDDNSLLFLAEMAPWLRSLRLISCSRISESMLERAIAKFTLLEELELSLFPRPATFRWALEAAGEACPHLRRLRLSRRRFCRRDGVDDREAAAVAAMRRLRSLQLFANSLGNDGLAAILDGCTELESLDIRHCFNVEITMDDDDGEMRARCARIQTLRLPGDSMDDYDLPFESPDMDYGSGSMLDYSFRGDILYDSW